LSEAAAPAAIPRVAAVELTAVAVPYRPELGTVVTAGLSLTEARHVLVEVVAGDGSVGLGEAVPRPSVYGETLEGIRSAIEGLLGPPLIGMAATDTERAWAAWGRVVGNQSAKAALDVALHDLVARRAGVPLFRLLGGWTDGSIPLTMAIGIGRPTEMAEGARRAVAAGYRSLKLKVGKDVTGDVAAVAAVRKAIGPDVTVYVDANGGYNRVDALRAMRGFERHGVALVEEPIAAWDTEGRARLARASDIPLLLDESTNDLAAVPREIAAGTAGAISVRAARSGVSLTRHLVGIAEASNVPCLVGSHRELGVGVAANAHIAAAFRSMAYPAELGSHAYLEDGLLTEPLRIEAGRLRLPSGPGLGVALDRERVERYRIWSAVIGERPS
jgi:L-alanine-DL-glutamate epimerase-like enolase superfamily enzyme